MGRQSPRLMTHLKIKMRKRITYYFSSLSLSPFTLKVLQLVQVLQLQWTFLPNL
jgi:hypothetical protein